MKKEKVLLAMSGGIDSSFSAFLLQKKGFEVVGITLKMWNSKNDDFIKDAKEVAKKLNFNHYVLDVIDKFEKEIIGNFINEYMNARTPNPCVICNIKIKWDILLKEAKNLNCKYFATGHYAQIQKENDRFFIAEAMDEKKDQSYFLWGLSQEVLSKAIFPLGKYRKKEILKIAEKEGFTRILNKKESLDICFIPDGNYRTFLKKNVKNFEKKILKGNFIDKNGKILGEHKGFPFYTIGQRKGLEIAVGYPLYVLKIDAKTNVITLGKREELLKKTMFVGDFNILKYKNLNEKIEVTTKIRYRNKGILSEIEKIGDKIKVVFFEDNFAITKGQSAVFYEEDKVIGGGIIL